MDPPGVPSGSGRGEKRPASDPADASELFKRGGPKSIRASAAPRADAGNRRPAGDAEGAGDDGRRARATNADADDEKLDGAREGAVLRVSGETATDDADGGSLRSRPRLLAKFRALCVALARRLSAHADNVTVAVWREELGVAEVLRPRGKHMNRMGYVVGARTFLFPEETAFLVETERLALLASLNPRDGEPLSLRAARALCVGAPRHGSPRGSRISSDLYALYAHLARRGYVVRRYGAPWNADSKNGEKLIHKKNHHAFYAGAGSVWRDAAARADEDEKDTETVVVASDTARDTIQNETETTDARYDTNASPGSVPAWYPSARRWLSPSAGAAAGPGPGPGPARDETVFSAETKKRPTASASGRASARVASPAFRAYAPNGNFSKKNPGEPLFYAFLEQSGEEESTKKKTSANETRAPSFRAAAAAAAALRREVGEDRLEGKVAWASVAGGVVVLHGFEDIRQ